MEVGHLGNFFTSLPADWIIIGSFALLMFIDALRVGSARISTLAIAALITLLINESVAKAAFFGSVSLALSTPVLQAIFFTFVYMLIYFLIRRIYIDYGELHGQPLQAFFAAIAVSALIILVWVQVPALNYIWNFGGQVQAVFGETYRFWWILLGLAALAFAKA